MLYMHSLTSDRSEEVLLDCLRDRSFDVVVDVLSNKGMAKENSRIKNVMRDFYYQRGFECATDSLTLKSRRNIDEQLTITVCDKQA